MQRILYVGSDLPDKSASGLRVFYNSLAIKEYGFDVDVLSFERNITKKEQIVYKNIRIIRIPYPVSKKGFIKYLFSPKTIKDTIDEYGPYDCVICYELPSFSFRKLYRECKKKNIKLICDSAEWHTANHLHGIAKIMKKIDVFFSMHLLYKKCDGMIVISDFLLKHFNHKNIILIPPLQEHYNIEKVQNKNKRVFIYAGSPGADKDNLPMIISAFNKIDFDYELHIFGIDYISYTHKMAKNQSLSLEKRMKEKKIVFHGYVDRNLILEQYKKTDFSIIVRNPTRRNNAGFPTKFCESICCLTPVICNDFSDLKKYVKENSFGLLIKNLCDDEVYKTFLDAIKLKDDDIKELIINCEKTNLFDYRYYINSLGLFIDNTINGGSK